MTNVALAENNGRFTARIHGHADYGPHGADIVCAAVSMLSQTLIKAIMDAPQGMIRRVEDCRAEGGHVTVRLETYATGQDYMRCVFSVISGGFELLQKKYPDCVAVGRKVQP